MPLFITQAFFFLMKGSHPKVKSTSQAHHAPRWHGPVSPPAGSNVVFNWSVNKYELALPNVSLNARSANVKNVQG